MIIFFLQAEVKDLVLLRTVTVVSESMPFLGSATTTERSVSSATQAKSCLRLYSTGWSHKQRRSLLRTGKLQIRQERNRADLQRTNPLWEISHAPARPLPCLHRLQEGFDRVCHATLWAIMKRYNVSANLIRVIKNFYDKAISVVLFKSSIGGWFRTTVGVQKGCLLSRTRFNIIISGKDQAWDTLQDSTDNSSTDKAETSLDWQEYFSQFKDTTDALLVTSIFLYVCESWTLTAELQRRIQAMEMRCYRKTVRISYKDNVTNEEVRAMFQQALGPHKDLLTIVKWRKLQWYDHVSRLSGLVKTILQGTVKGERRQDRQRKRCEYNIRELTGLEFAKSQRAVENREHGGNWLRNYLWCPNDPRVME